MSTSDNSPISAPTAEQSALGKPTHYASHYDPGLLFAIPRAPKRAEIGITGALPFYGVDIWNAYELSWLDTRGKPIVALAELRVPADSPHIVESKSLKLYLNGFAQTRQDDAASVAALIERDLSHTAQAPVVVTLAGVDTTAYAIKPLLGQLLDQQALTIDHYGPPCADFLRMHAGDAVEETLVSHLLRSNCPVTGQPDWGSVQITYRGAPIDHASLLKYLVSFRTHSGFHEQCVEQIFMDLHQRCAPSHLSVYARYTRRGGLDINPFRSTRAQIPGNSRAVRQ